MIYSLAFYRHYDSGYESPNAGSSRGVFFERYILPTIRAAKAIYPDWEIRIHHDQRVKEFDSWAALQDLDVTLVDCGHAPSLCEAMLWRLKPLWDGQTVVCRDVDSLPMPRERVMLEEFLASDAIVHAILDSESHTGPIMGGMSAFKPAWTPCDTWDDFVLGWNLQRHGSDQLCLNHWWHKTEPKTLIHQVGELVRYAQPWVESRPVAPRTCPGDELVWHLGAPYPIEKAEALYADA